MNIRDQRQEEFADIFIRTGMFGILDLCPRFGKIFTTINILEKVFCKRVLIAYPDKNIKESWERDFEKRKYADSEIIYSTHMSLKKFSGEYFDLVVIDEIHLLSAAQIEAVKELRRTNRKILGLTGTLSSWTKTDLMKQLHLPVVGKYSIAQAIEEKIISDYEITIVQVPLDTRILIDYGKKIRTEKQRFDSFSWVINKLQLEGKENMFMRLKRLSIIKESLGKKNKTISLLKELSQERILVFCGVTKIADELGIPSYHSKSSEKHIFKDFSEGKGNHLAVCKLGNTGVTYKPLNRVIINYFDSNSQNLTQKINRCMGFEYDNPEKKAKIFIISSNEEVELKWLQQSLEFFDKSKIKYV